MAESVYVFQHIACEDLGTFAAVLSRRGLGAEYVRLFAGDRIPPDAGNARALIFLGGSMSVNDAARLGYLAEEKAVIRAALAKSMPILGVCLGSQLLAAAAGARVYPASRPEIGWEAVSLTEDGRRDPVLSGLGNVGAVFHWHGETFDLPVGAVLLASSAITPHQAFRLGRRAYGLQFHLEVDAAMIGSWVAAYRSDLGADPDAAAQRIADDTGRHIDSLRAAAAQAMESFLDTLGDTP